MGRYNLADLKLSEDGDLVVTNGDLALVYGDDFIAQGVRTRFKSVSKNWFYDKIGMDMEKLIGKPNTRETGDEGKAIITKNLTIDGFIDQPDIYVEAVPVSKSEILFFVFINTPSGADPIGFEVALDLASGIMIREV